MAQKLNKKLVFVVGSLALLVVLGGAVTLVLRFRFDAERHIKAGDALVAAGDYRKAADQYGRAVAKKATNLGYLEKFRKAILEITPETENESRERYQQYLSALANEARVARDDMPKWRTFIEAFRAQAEASDASSTWKAFAERCDDMMRVVAEDGVGAAVARLNRGYAGFRRIDSLNDSERAAAVLDLETGLKSKELTADERDLGIGTLMRMAVRERAIAGGAGRADRIEATQATMEKAFERATAESASGVRIAMARLERALFEAQGKASAPAVADASEELGKAVRASTDPITILGATQVLVRGGTVGVEEAQAVLAEFVAKNPDQLLHRRFLGTMMRASDREAARRELQAVIDAPRPKTGLLAAIYAVNRSAASLLLFDIAFDEAERATGEERNALVAQAVTARDGIAKMLEGAPDNSALLRADAKVALLKGDTMGAIIKFNEIFKKGSQIDLELYILSALAHMRVQEVGRALELVSGGLTLSPGNVALLKLRARLELGSARTREAIQTLRSVIDAYPDDQEAKDLLAMATGAQAQDPTVTGGVDPFVESAARVQAAAEAKDYAGARRILAELREKMPGGDARIARMAVGVEAQANDLEAARRLTREGLAQYPNDSALIRLNALLASDDVVERVIAFSEGALEDEKERAVLTYLRLLQTGQTSREQADREKRLGLASAARTAENAAKLEAAAAEWRTKAEQADRAHPALIEVDFNKAIEAKDYTAAEAIAKIAEQSGRDRTQAPILRARILLVQDRNQEAAAVLERSIQEGVDASTIYRTLGSALERLGNIDGALRAYEESYKRRPSDMSTVRLLVGALVRSGNPTRGLEVLRQARALAGFDEDVGNTWLMLEQQLGDRRLAQRMRENRYRIAPGDAENAVALATILALSAPDRDDIVSENGRAVYTENQWNAMDAPSRNRELDRVREDWRKRAETIYTDVLARDPGNLDAANSFAGLLRAMGRLADAERVLAQAVEKAGTNAGWRGLVMLAQLQIVVGAEDRARASLDAAVARQDPKTKPAARAAVDMLMGIERFPLALTYLEPLAAEDGTPAIRMRLAECLLRVNRNADARKVFDAAVAAGPREIGAELLDGAIYTALGDEYRGKGETDKARAEYEKAIPPYQRAKQLAPGIPQPFIQDAMLKRKLFEITGDRTRGEEALASADRASSIGATFFPAAAVRSEVLIVLGDLNGAVAELERYLRIVPTAVDARRRLVDLLYSNKQFDRAEEALRAAIGYAPGEPAWHFTLGDLLAQRGRLPEAAASYARADALRPDAATFFRQLDALIRAREFRGAIDASRARGELVRDNAVARAYLGAALVAIGEKGDGVSTLRESFGVAKKAYDAGNAQMMQDWYGAVRLIFAPGLLNEAEALVKDVSGGDPTPVGWDYLSFLALGNDSAGPAKVVSYLEPVAGSDFSSMPELGAAFYDRLGTSYYLTGNCQKAIATFERALALTPGNHAVLNNYAYLCIECLKDAKKALPAARRAVQLQPTRGEYLDTLALALISDGQAEEGLEYAERAAKLGDSAPVQLHRAMALKALGRDAQAREALRRATDMNPDPPTKASIEQLSATLK